MLISFAWAFSLLMYGYIHWLKILWTKS